MADGFVTSILNWLRAGYPEGVPAHDHFPLLALLHNTLSEAEFAAVIETIEKRNPDPVKVSTIRKAINRVTNDEMPSEQDMRLVASRLAAAGWPLSNRARGLAEEPSDQPTSD